MKNTSQFIWTVFFVLVVPLTIYTVYSGFIVGEMQLPGGFKFVFREKPKGIAGKKLDNLSQAELEKRQEQLEKRFKELEQKQGNFNQGNISPQTQSINITGTWYSPNGLSYRIEQRGNLVALQEVNPFYGVTAVGQGQIQGQSVLINYQTAAYTQGVANLTISPEGRSLNGFFRDNYSGYTIPMTLSR